MASCRNNPDTSLELSSYEGQRISHQKLRILRLSAERCFTSSEYTSLIPRSSPQPARPVRLASSIAPKNPHPYASDAFLGSFSLAPHFQSVVSENVVSTPSREPGRPQALSASAGRPLRSNGRSRHDDAYNTDGMSTQGQRRHIRA